MTDTAVDVLGVFEAYKRAVAAKDVDAFVALYERDVRIFDLWKEWSYDGRGAWRDMVAGWLGTLGSVTVMVDFVDVRTMVVADMAVAHAFVIYRGLSSDGVEVNAMQNRLTWVLKQTQAVWRIIHEHTSAPVDLESAKVILRPT